MASSLVDGLDTGTADSVDIESDVDDEVDELDSDTDAGDSDPNTANLSTKKKASGRQGVRVPGQSVLPAVRIENIIQADGVTGNLALSREGLFVLSVATEEFVKRMSQAGHRQASSQRRNIVTYADMAVTTRQYQEFMFLTDTIPTSLPLSEALHLREAKEKALLEGDPAMASSFCTPPHTGSGPAPGPENSMRKRGNGWNINGRELLNGTSGSVLTGPRNQSRHDSSNGDRVHIAHQDSDEPIEVDGTWPEGSTRNTQVSGPHRASYNGEMHVSTPRSPPVANGHSSTVSRSGTLTPRDGVAQPNSPPLHTHLSRTPPHGPQEEPPWPGQYTGPASGFLQGPGGPYSRSAHNPGRTIYSQNHTPD